MEKVLEVVEHSCGPKPPRPFSPRTTPSATGVEGMLEGLGTGCAHTESKFVGIPTHPVKA